MKYLVLIIFISILPLMTIFSTPDLIHTHDGLVHLPRMAAYFKMLADGQIPIRWAADLNHGYGMPLFNFIYQLPYLISSLFLFAGAGLVTSFKLTLSLSFVLSGICMFLFTKAFFVDDKKALLATVFYQFAPFRLIEVIQRGSFGEVYTYVFLPLVLFGLTMLWKKHSYRYFFLTAIATALLILSHNSVSLLFFLLSAAFIIFFARGKKDGIAGGLALFGGLLLSMFYWFPAIFDHKYTYGDLHMKTLYLEHFAPVGNILIPNITNAQNLHTGGISVQIGLFHLLATIVVLGLLVAKKMDAWSKRLAMYCLLPIGMSFFFMLPVSKPFWENISFLRQFQFPWRFLSLIVFATSLLSVYFLTLGFLAKKYILYGFMILVIASTGFFWKAQEGFDSIDEAYYWDFPLTTTYYGETDVIWSAGPAASYPQNPVELSAGQADITGFKKQSARQEFTVEAKTDAWVVSHTQYFPGWRAYVDGNSVPIEFQNPNWRGMITFPVLPGTHRVKLAFEETKPRLVADGISLGTFVVLLFFFMRAGKKRYAK